MYNDVGKQDFCVEAVDPVRAINFGKVRLIMKIKVEISRRYWGEVP